MDSHTGTNFVVYEGRVTRVTSRFHPVQLVEFKIDGQGVDLVADHRFLDLHPEDRVYAVCRPDGEGMAIVLEMLRCAPGQAIAEEEKAWLLERCAASARPQAPHSPASSCDEIYQHGLQAARDEYVRARGAGMSHPVIFLCPLDVYRALRPAGREYAVEFNQAMEEATGNRGANLVVEDHAHLYEGLLIYSPGAAAALGSMPDPSRPFRVVVMTRHEAKVYSPSVSG